MALRVSATFATFNFRWLVSLLGLIFVPWTASMYALIFPLNGWNWIWLGFGVVADIFSHSQK